MKKTYVTGTALASLLVAFILAGAARAGVDAHSRQPAELKKIGAGFAVSGTFTGTLDGSVTIGDRQVLITRKTTIFEVGSGPVKKRPRLVNIPVYAAGSIKRGVLVASVVVITGRNSPRHAVPLTEELTRPRERKIAR